MKFSMSWHKDVLSNQLRSLKNLKEEQERYIKRTTNDINRLEEEVKFHQYQISEAEKEGKMAFDHERYKIKRPSSKNK